MKPIFYCMYLSLFFLSRECMNATTATFTIIGSGTCMPAPHRQAPGNLLQVNNEYYLIDSGPGILQACAARGYDLTKLKGVFYTHFHFDHIADLATIIPWLHVRAWATKHNSASDSPVPFTIYGPIGIKEHVESLYRHTALPPLPTFVQIIEMTINEPIKLNGVKVVAHKVPHTKESVGYHFTFTNQATLAVTGDTGYGEEVINLIKDVDIAVLECSYDDKLYLKTKNEVKHLSPTVAAQLAEEAKVKMLVLTHIYPYADAVDIKQLASNSFKGSVKVATDGLSLEIFKN